MIGSYGDLRVQLALSMKKGLQMSQRCSMLEEGKKRVEKLYGKDHYASIIFPMDLDADSV